MKLSILCLAWMTITKEMTNEMKVDNQTTAKARAATAEAMRVDSAKSDLPLIKEIDKETP
jgi:hypothetical protein